jgi:hypothetical protein
MTGGQAECAFDELELMKRAVAQRAGWSAAWCALECYERERIGLVRLGKPARHGILWSLVAGCWGR